MQFTLRANGRTLEATSYAAAGDVARLNSAITTLHQQLVEELGDEMVKGQR